MIAFAFFYADFYYVPKQACHSERSTTTTSSSSVCNGDATDVTSPSSSASASVPSPVNPRAEGRQFEVLQRQFDNAGKHLKNHAEEIR